MNVFDIIGPVMIGPSSSHTAGAARIGRIAYMLLGQPAKRAEILLHGSFAKTYKGHGTDKELIAGIMGMKPDDARLRSSFELAEQAGLSEVVLEPVVKTVALSILTRLTVEICRSAGEGGVAAFVETAGAVLALLAALPLVRAVAQLMGELLS